MKLGICNIYPNNKKVKMIVKEGQIDKQSSIYIYIYIYIYLYIQGGYKLFCPVWLTFTRILISI